jgi:hypothetical protein
MLSDGFQGPTAMVRLLLVQWNVPCRDAKVSYSDILSVAIRRDQRLQRCIVKIVADIPVELTIAAVARIAPVCTPNLCRGFAIARESKDGAGADDRSV